MSTTEQQEQNSVSDLFNAVDGAQLVETRQDWALAFVWHGGHGVNVYSTETGNEIDFFNVGDFAESSASEEDVREGIKDYITYYKAELVRNG